MKKTDKTNATFNLLRARLESERKRLIEEMKQLKSTMRPADERREGSPFGKREEEATETLERYLNQDRANLNDDRKRQVAEVIEGQKWMIGTLVVNVTPSAAVTGEDPERYSGSSPSRRAALPQVGASSVW